MIQGHVIGYDPGGNWAHGILVVDVRRSGTGWVAERFHGRTGQTVGDAIAWLSRACGDGNVVAVGIDTLSEWSSGDCGWRPADQWLRVKYPEVRNSVMAPNSIASAMTVNGAAFLTLLAPRFLTDGSMVTEAHPKVCYYALTRRRHAWEASRAQMARWLTDEFSVEPNAELTDSSSHVFDAGLAALAALRGVNGDWKRDLHALNGETDETRIRFCGPTHFWWPE